MTSAARSAGLRGVAAASTALGEVRAHGVHMLAGGLVVGLLAGAHAPVVILVALALCPLVAGRALPALALAAALLVGAVVADARLQALDHTTLDARVGHATTERVILLEPGRPRSLGGRTAVAELGSERVQLRTDGDVAWPAARAGEELRVDGVLRRLGPRDAWLRPRNVHAVLEADRVVPTGRARGGLAGALDAVRSRAERGLDTGVPPPQAALLRGMVLGQDDALPGATREDFQAAGLSHLVAASGQNVMLLAALVLGAASLVGVGLRARLLSVLALIAVYVPLAGGGPSIQRAGVMGAAGVTATLAGRPASRWYALLLAAAVTLTLNPRAVEEPGWQMSFAAVAAIMVLTARVTEPLRRRGLPPGLAEAVGMTVAATIGTAPLIAIHFDRTSLVSLAANVLAAPAVAPVMWLGMAAAAIGQVSQAAAMPFVALAGYPLAFIGWVGHTAARVPGAEIAASPVAVALVCAVAAAAVVWPAARRPHAAALAAVAVAAVVVWSLPPRPPGPPAGLRITFLDVGQGDATLIQHGQTSVLVDAGPPGGGVVTRLRRAGVKRLDLLVVTHAQADHQGGAQAVLRALPVGLVLDGRDGVREPLGARMAAEARQRRVPRALPDAGETVRAGRIELRVLWPVADRPGAGAGGADPNQRAVVMEARVGRFRILLTADAESDVLAGLGVGPVDVLKVAHHGSADPGLAALLSRLRPSVAAIHVGARNTYGHPVPATIRALRAAGAAVYRTDHDGSVRLDEQGPGLAVTPHAGVGRREDGWADA
ncbi:MAG: competence protein ComEC [Solirubrobacteraceae bacterium]|nr:competence protein ComEC [Solirubrobacteraceae bacterium]